MRSHLHESASRIGKLLLVAVIAITGVTGVASSASAATFSTKQAQWNLAGLGYLSYSGVDGKTGPNTRSAIRAFQGNRCLSKDGLIGPKTTAELSSLMKKVQSKVGTKADGKNGLNTKAKIKAWQKRNKLPADGMAGENTLKKMGIAYKKSSCPPPEPMCAPGTKNLGVHQTYVRGTRVFQGLCAIPGFRSSSEESTPGSRYYIRGSGGNVIVSRAASKNTLKMFQAAKKDGVTLSARSSFRTMAHQKALCRQDSGCRNGNYGRVVKPGRSTHQSGIAIDFNLSATGYQARASCTSNRSMGKNSKVWDWLQANAHKYRFRQNAAEAWHWEYTSQSSTRC